MSKTLRRPYKRSVLKDFDPSKTTHSQAYETDINNMVKGLTPFTQSRRPSFYIDETVIPLNYEEAFNAVCAAQDAFMALPPDVRERFDNDPALLAQAMGDPANYPALREMGILAPLDDDIERQQQRARLPAQPDPGKAEPPPVKPGKEAT